MAFVPDFADFQIAVRNRTVMTPHTWLSSGRAEIGRWKPFDEDWSVMPSFDFGYYLDHVHRDGITLDQWDKSWNVGSQMVEADAFKLPFERCAYIFRYSETEQRHENTNILFLHQIGTGILGRVFYRQPAMPGPMGLWTAMPCGFYLTSGGVEFLFDDDLMSDDAQREEMALDMRAKYTEMMAATLALNAEPSRREVYSEATGKLLKIMKSAKVQKRLARSIKIVINRPVVDRMLLEGAGSRRSSPIGHERRGHYRTYASGKRTWVDAMKVRGGGPARDYVVAAERE